MKFRELGRSGVQAYLKKGVKRLGGMIEHFTSPGKRGVPDLIVTWRGPVVHFIETKAQGKTPRPEQRRDHIERAQYGVIVHVLDTKQKIDEYLSGASLL